MKRRLIIDTDPGIDDALALLLAAKSPELAIEAVTVVAGNVPLNIGTNNALRVLDLVKSANAIPVFPGADQPINDKLNFSNKIHGKDGLGDCDWPSTTRQPEEKHAVDVIIDSAKLFPKELTLICLGPLTNLALAIERDPQAVSNYQEIIIMGGAATVAGNVTPVAEFNFWADPQAAKRVIAWAKTPITTIGLDVTKKVMFSPIHREILRQVNTPISSWVHKITRHYLNVYWELGPYLGCVLHDPLVIAAAIMPEMVEAPAVSADIATDDLCRGQLVIDQLGIWNKRKNIRVALNVDSKHFIEEFICRLASEKLTLQELRDILRLTP